MKRRIKPSNNSAQNRQNDPLAGFVQVLDGVRNAVRTALKELRTDQDLNSLTMVLSVLWEIRAQAEELGEKELADLLIVPMSFTYRRLRGKTPEEARRDMDREYGIPPEPNAPYSDVVN